MKVLLQRVSSAAVRVEEKLTGEIEQGLLLLVGFGRGDTEANLRPMAEKLVHLRIFPNEAGKFHFSVLDIGGGFLLVPQFTLFGDTRKGRRPEFFSALEPKEASRLFELFKQECVSFGLRRVEAGVFGADMKVSLLNDGPVTMLLDDAQS